MENNVTSLSVSKKLKEAGFEKDSCYQWVQGNLHYENGDIVAVTKSDKWQFHDGSRFGIRPSDFEINDINDEKELEFASENKIQEYRYEKKVVKAYQVNKLLAELPKLLIVDEIHYSLGFGYIDETVCADYQFEGTGVKCDNDYAKIIKIPMIKSDTLQDALGLMKIWHIKWLKENDYINAK